MTQIERRGEANRWRVHLPAIRALSAPAACALAVALVGLVSLVGIPVHLAVSPTNLTMLYLAAVVVCALYLGRGPAILAAVLSVVALDFFFVPPRLTFNVHDTEYLVTFAGLFVVGLIVSSLAAQAREQAATARRGEAQAVALYEYSRDLSAATSPDDIARTITGHATAVTEREASVLLDHDVEPDMAHGLSVPLEAAGTRLGVLIIGNGNEQEVPAEQRRLLAVFASQAGLALGRLQLADQARQATLLRETEKLQTALLNSISHDLRTPLVSITGALTALDDEAASADEFRLGDADRRSLLSVALEEAQRLNRLVGNLLDITRLEAHALRIASQPSDVAEVIGAVLDRLDKRTAGRELRIDLAPDLPLVPLDFVLMVQVLYNLLDNALKYSAGSPITLCARVQGDRLEVRLEDCGPGVPDADLERIFDKFHRIERPEGASGTGLGLSICRGIIEAHAGRIWAQKSGCGGLGIVFTLPLDGRQPEIEVQL